MSTLFVERSGACIGNEALISENALVRVASALPEADRARLRWVVGYVGNRLLAADEIRDMGTWMDLFGHAREVGLDMGQIRAFIDAARGERFLQKHEVRVIGSNGDAQLSLPKNGRILKTNGANGHAIVNRGRKTAVSKVKPRKEVAASHTNGHTSPTVKIGAVVKDLDRRRERSGRIIEVGQNEAKIKWDSGRINEISLKRLLTPRLFRIQ